MTKLKFTFKNYLQELKKSYLLLIILLIIGLAGGAFYAFSRKTQYVSHAKLLVNNSAVDNGSATSPYAQIGELLSSKKLLETVNTAAKDVPAYEVIEMPRGVFMINVTDNNGEHAKEIANAVLASAGDIISTAFDNASDYRITIIEEASEPAATVSMKSRLVSIAIAGAAMLIVGAVIVFIKFDYNSEK